MLNERPGQVVHPRHVVGDLSDCYQLILCHPLFASFFPFSVSSLHNQPPFSPVPTSSIIASPYSQLPFTPKHTHTATVETQTSTRTNLCTGPLPLSLSPPLGLPSNRIVTPPGVDRGAILYAFDCNRQAPAHTRL
ncbi:unnamed protein product [Protopolystoma xenopodis]|uniref:Uncharacterized protein n=1 Tax=Protopolystoma xenopodis TaxID=117903 RepID=A0A448X460_9PLAT|nr:unnamed protein product [Protopolystoma xenopodis]